MNSPRNSQSSSQRSSLTRARLKLLALLATPLAPILLAWAAFHHFPALIPKATTQGGTLIQPPVQAASLAPALAATQAWTLIHLVRGTNCPADYQRLLYRTRQVVKGLGRDAPRVTRTLAVSAPLPPEFAALLAAEHPDLQALRVADTRPLAALAPPPALLLMDPQGHIMMRYTSSQAGKPLREDLKRLLR